MAAEWFRRMADISSLGFTGGPNVVRHRLQGADSVPERRWSEVFEEYRLDWPASYGETSASPAHRRAFRSDLSEMSTVGLLQHTWETLEVPGEASDYHFAIQHCLEELWKRRRAEPDVLTEVERFAWLDVRLVSARPDAILHTMQDGSQSYAIVRAFERLISLYEREGALHEALEVAGLATRFEQGEADRDRLRTKLMAVMAEEPQAG